MSTNESPPLGTTLARASTGIRGRLAVAVLCQLIAALGAAAPLLCTAIAITTLLDPGSSAVSYPRLAIVGVIGVLVAAVAAAAALFFSHLADLSFQATTRHTLLQQLSRVRITWFSGAGTTRIKRAMTDDVDSVHYVLSHALLDAVMAVATPMLCLGFVAWLDLRLLVPAVLPVVASIVINRLLARRIRAGMAEYHSATKDLDHAAADFVRANTVLRVFGRPSEGTGTWEQAYNAYGSFLTRWSGRLTPGLATQDVIGSPLVSSAVVLSTAVWAPQVPVGHIVAVALIAPAVTAPLTAFTFAWNDLVAGFAALQRLHTVVVDTAAACDSPSHAAGESPKPGVLAGHGITVVRGNKTVLESVAVTAHRPQLVALVGRSGAGKSTLLEALSGIITPEAGQVWVTGQDIHSQSPLQRAELVNVLWQDIHFIRSSVAENLRLFSPGASPEELQRAAQDAGIADRIAELPGGYEAVIGEGLNLSGGERQRLALARALVGTSPVLLLDEPTSACDPEREQHIVKTLREQGNTRAVFVTDHRLNIAAVADRVIVVEEGQIVEDAAPELLLQRPHSVYASLLAGRERGAA